jgi:hypothetical protein
MSLSLTVISQVKDKAVKSIRIPAAPSKVKKEITPVKVKVAPKPNKQNEKSSNKTELNQTKFIIKAPKTSFSMIDHDGLKSPSEIYEKRWSKDLEKGGIIKTMSDQFLGEHNVDTKFVNIVCRDHEYADGDRVRIYIDDIIVKQNLLLTNSFRRVEVDLIQGKNTIKIEALNQGDSGPNTAEFLVYDDRGNLISSKAWNLLTGVKAIIVFYNEKVTITENKKPVITKKEPASEH